MAKYVILVAVEDYADPAIPKVVYAEADARELGKALEQHGFDSGEQIILINSGATKSIIESRVRTLLGAATEDDTVYLFYAGHGFSKNGANYITCHDTLLSDLADMSIPLSWFFRHFRKSRCKKIAMFLDSCESGVLANVTMRGIYSDLTDEELRDFFDVAEHRVCFAACKTGESSWPSGHLKHGVWTYHLIEAFNGNAPLALVRNGLLTSASLQNHLTASVPRSLRKAYADKKVQTPWMYGGQSSEFLLAELEDVLARRKVAATPGAKQVVRVTLLGEDMQTVRSLSGFRKFHTVPDHVSGATSSFVHKIADDELSKDLDKMYAALRKAFAFKLDDLDASDPEDGAGTIITPYFTYNVSVGLNPEDPSEVVWRREVTDIKEPEQVFSDAFASVFDDMFDTIEFSPPSAVDVRALIQRIQHLNDDRIEVEHDRGATWCDLTIDGQGGKIHVTKYTFQIVKDQPEPPRLLVQSFFDIQHALVDTHDIRLIPFDAPDKK